jgi:2-oxoglutarate ferredoxin oxidoreductase subunit alpha
MVELRAQKVERIADTYPPLEVFGPETGDVLVVGWGSTYGAIHAAVQQHHRLGHAVSQVHIRYVNPLPKDLGTILAKYKHVLVPELNRGQLDLLLRARYLISTHALHKVRGQPYRIAEIFEAIETLRSGQRLNRLELN